MKALLVTNKPFLPVIDGGTAASESFAKQLIHDGFEIEYITFYSEKHNFDPILFNAEHWNSINPLGISLKLKPNLIDATKCLLKNKSYQLARFESYDFIQILQQKKINFDFIIFDSLFSAQMIEKVKRLYPKAKIILRAHNVEHIISEQKLLSEKNAIKKIYLGILSKQLKKREIEIINQCDLVLSISEKDNEIFLKYTLKKCTTLPYFPKNERDHWVDTPNRFMHFGAMNWQPNVISYEKLVSKIFPKILKKCPEAKLKIAGSFMESIKISSNPNFEYLGFVDDKYQFLASKGILLAPIENGSGVRIKIIEALSIGVPIITTSIGAQGIPVENNHGLIICDTDEEFIEKSIELCHDHSKRMELSKAALDFYAKWQNSFSLKNLILENVS